MSQPIRQPVAAKASDRRRVSGCPLREISWLTSSRSNGHCAVPHPWKISNSHMLLAVEHKTVVLIIAFSTER